MHTLRLVRNDLSFESGYADLAFLVLCDANILRLRFSALVVHDGTGVEQVTDVITIKLQELHLHSEFAELRLLAPVLNFIEDEVEDARHDSDLLRR